MAKGPEITDGLRMLISKLHDKHPKWTNKKIRLEVQKIMHRRDKTLAKKWPNWPSIHSIDRIMADIRKLEELRKLNPDSRDKPWTIQSMANPKYAIPPEALPAVLRAWYLLQDRGYALTIRDAQWVARLYAAIQNTENLCAYSGMVVGVEKRAEDAGIEDFRGPQAHNLYLFSTMTGHKITLKEQKRLLGWSDELWDTMREVLKGGPTVREQTRTTKSDRYRPLRFGLHYEPDAFTMGDETIVY